MALIHYAVTLFVSAFILFLVQPLIGKLVLPKLGGTPQVWNTCMVFFQMVLLLGYFYTHAVSTRLKARQQLLLHLVVMLLPFAVFAWRPFWFIREWDPPLGTNPIFATLTLLASVVGIPFFVVSTTAPLLQKWFGMTGHPAAKDPYFLYGASNLGSMLSLIVYPVAIEPYTLLVGQSKIWIGSYVALALCVIGCVALVWAKSGAAASASGGSGGDSKAAAAQSLAQQTETIDGMRRLKWIALAAVPSSMMLGVTSHITTDLSPIPFFWLVPLALYLASFIFVFARWPMVWVESPHQAMVYLQPFAIAFMILSEVVPGMDLWAKIAANVLGFFFTTMVCHGELAKDRPSTKFLTDFYLMMSVGGMVGGMINALIAPLFPWVFEFNAAIMAACLLRPSIPGPLNLWLDNALAGGGSDPVPAVKGRKPTAGPSDAISAKRMPAASTAAARADGDSGESHLGMDVVVGIVIAVIAFALIITLLPSGRAVNYLIAYLVPLALALMFLFRPIRFGLAIAGILIAHEYHAHSSENAGANRLLHSARSYFGVIRVKLGHEPEPYTTLIHGHINHGQNFRKPANAADPDYSRLATTYYHRKGPVGVVMEKFNWFRDPTSNNSFWADARMPAGLVTQGAFGALGAGTLPLGQLVEAWTEPPIATIGLGTGTMASYARPFQHCHFYEIDEQIRRLSLPVGGGTAHFTYLQDALERGAEVQVLMGDARQRMAYPYQNYHTYKPGPRDLPGGGPEGFYHMMVVDAFSSDAIPAHLLTKEAFEMYFKHLSEEGILCVHTSNRYVDLPRVVADVADSLGYVATRGHDNVPSRLKNKVADKDRGHFTSEWVMVARKAPGLARNYLKHLREPEGYSDAMRQEPAEKRTDEPYWRTPATHGGRYLWTDDYYNLLSVLRAVLPRGE